MSSYKDLMIFLKSFFTKKKLFFDLFCILIIEYQKIILSCVKSLFKICYHNFFG